MVRYRLASPSVPQFARPCAPVENGQVDPGWASPLKAVWIMHRRLRRLAAGQFASKPTSCSIYMLESPN